jgi:hypothetical protein
MQHSVITSDHVVLSYSMTYEKSIRKILQEAYSI